MSELLVMVIKAQPEVKSGIIGKSGMHSCRWIVHWPKIINSHNVCGQLIGCSVIPGASVPAEKSGQLVFNQQYWLIILLGFKDQH